MESLKKLNKLKLLTKYDNFKVNLLPNLSWKIHSGTNIIS